MSALFLAALDAGQYRESWGGYKSTVARVEETIMGRNELLRREWVEIVLVLDDGTLIDSAYDLHEFDGRRALLSGFYLAVHAGEVRDFGKAELVGPFLLRGMVEMLYDSARHLGAAGSAEELSLMRPVASVLPLIRRQAAAAQPAYA